MASVPQSTGTLKPATPVVTYDMHTDTWTDRRQAAWQQAAEQLTPYQPRLQAVIMGLSVYKIYQSRDESVMTYRGRYT